MKVLIIEDEDILLRVIREKLEDKLYETAIARDGAMALSILKNFTPDIILLDLLLPKVSGLEVLASIKKDDNLKNIPVIILSNLSNSENIKKGLTLGAVDYLIKTEHPINEVIDMVDKYILKAK